MGEWIEGVSDNGAPVHAEANGWYWYSDYDGRGVTVYGEWGQLSPHDRAAQYLRIAPAELPTGMDRDAFRAFIETLRPRWAVEGPAIHAANVARKQAREREYRERDKKLAEGVRIVSKHRDPNPTEASDYARDPGATFWTVRLSYEGRSMTTPFHMGSAHRGEPDAADVLGALLMDAEGIASEPDYADWCAGYGWEQNTKTRRIYNEVKRLSDDVRALLGDEYEKRAELARER